MATKEKRQLDLFDEPIEVKFSDREYQRKKMAERRKVERDIKIDYSKVNKRRRGMGRNRPAYFLRAYFPEIFYFPFTADQRCIINGIRDRILFGLLIAIAAERGGGKTSITKYLAVWAICYGWIDYLVIILATGREAEKTLKQIKDEFEFNELLCNDFPEICTPIVALEGAPQRAKSQTVNGKRTRFSWSGDEVTFPHVEGSAASGAIITTRGIDGSIRGLVRGPRRPKLVILDDIETKKSADSKTMTDDIRVKINKDILGLAAPGEAMAVVMLCTVINKKCLAWHFTDRSEHPEWNGIRQKWIKIFPKNQDLWEKYIDLFQADERAGDAFGRTAFEFYKANRKAMDLGAVVSNKNRYNRKKLPDGTPTELSSLQAAYNILARAKDDIQKAAFYTEYQNEPPDDDNIISTELSPDLVKKRVNGIPRGIIPAGAEYITGGIDIGGRLLHYVVKSWKPGMIGSIIDYGTDPIDSPLGKLNDVKNATQIQEAIYRALLIWRDRVLASGYMPTDGKQPRFIDLVNIDAGWMDVAIYRFVRSAGGKQYRACKGYGSNQNQGRYRQPSKGKVYQTGVNWWGSYQQASNIWLYHINADYWKLTVQNSFMIEPETNGATTIFGDDPYQHRTFGRHICAEKWKREFIPGKGTNEYFYQHDRNNHYLDAEYLADVAANMIGVRLDGIVEPKKEKISMAKRQELRRQGKL